MPCALNKDYVFFNLSITHLIFSLKSITRNNIAKVTLEKHHAKLAQRYARSASATCIGDYVARWTSWCKSVLKCADENLNKPMELKLADL